MARFDAEIRLRYAEASVREVDLIVEENEAMEGWTKIQNKHLAWAHRLTEAVNVIKQHYVLDVCERPLLWMMKWARGNPANTRRNSTF